MKTDQDETDSVLLYCPFLGLADDPETSLAFPSIWNNCHHSKPTASARLEHQRQFCLSTSYPLCPVYLQSPGLAFPGELKHPRMHGSGRKRLWNIFPVIFIALIVIVIGLFAFQIIPIQIPFESINSILPNTNTPIPVKETTTQMDSSTPTPILPNITPFTSPTLVTSFFIQETPSYIFTRIPNQIEALIGLSYVFRIHRIKNSDSLALLASENGTTETAIVTINYNLPIPLKTQTLAVIPVNRKDVSDLPKFEAYRVEEDVSLETLAEQLGVDPAQMQLYNGLGTYTQLFAGEWLVVPREKTLPD